jgi:signal transduction histidine kinase
MAFPLSFSLVEATRLVGQTDAPAETAASLIAHISEVLGIAGVSLWLLDRGTAELRPRAVADAGSWAGVKIPVKGLPLPNGSLGRATPFVERALDPKAGLDVSQRPGDCSLVVGRRGRTVVGVVLLEDYGPADWTTDHVTFLELIAEMIVIIYNRDFASHYLGATHEPVTFHASERAFFDSLILQTAVSARMQFVAIREFDSRSNGLVTLALWGFDDADNLSDWDLTPITAFPPFERALQGQTVVAPSMDSVEFLPLKDVPQLERVQSFVAVPITVGDEHFGVLSVAAGCEYEYNSLEQRAFRSLANAAGLAIDYFRLDHAMTSQIRDLTEVSSAVTAVEVAHAARHEAVVKIANARRATSNLHTAIAKGDGASALERLKGLQRDHLEIEASINKIKLATNPKHVSVERLPIKALWEEARSATHGKLGLQRVNFRIDGTSREVIGRPGHLRQVFMNLFLNSADAFEAQGKGSAKREIIVRVEPPPTPDAPVVCTYRDNAGGLQTQRLRQQVEGLDIPMERAIFEKGVTTRSDGTGYGLWLADRFMQQHDGSIRVKSHRGGLVFELELPHPSRSRLRAFLKE